MPICDHCKIKLDAQEPEAEPEPKPEPRRRGRPCHVVDKVAQKKIYNARYYVRCKERRTANTEIENKNDIIKEES